MCLFLVTKSRDSKEQLKVMSHRGIIESECIYCVGVFCRWIHLVSFRCISYCDFIYLRYPTTSKIDAIASAKITVNAVNLLLIGSESTQFNNKPTKEFDKVLQK